jgi:hypothetical protein
MALTSLLMACAEPRDPVSTKPETGLFVSVHIPEALIPLDRGAKYEEPLAAALHQRSLGDVTGGGTQLGPRTPEGKQDILAVDLDIELVDGERGLPVLLSELKKLNAPPGTELIYEEAGKQVRVPLW